MHYNTTPMFLFRNVAPRSSNDCQSETSSLHTMITTHSAAFHFNDSHRQSLVFHHPRTAVTTPGWNVHLRHVFCVITGPIFSLSSRYGTISDGRTSRINTPSVTQFRCSGNKSQHGTHGQVESRIGSTKAEKGWRFTPRNSTELYSMFTCHGEHLSWDMAFTTKCSKWKDSSTGAIFQIDWVGGGSEGEKCTRYHQNSDGFGLLFRFDLHTFTPQLGVGGGSRGGSRIFIGEGLQVQDAPPGLGGAPF